MKARDLIEAESAKQFINRNAIRARSMATPIPIRPVPLTSDQIERLATILSMGPINRRRSDQIFINAGVAMPYEGERTAIDAAPGAHKALFNSSGGIRKEWVADPNFREFNGMPGQR
jgi:hypothetical protein